MITYARLKTGKNRRFAGIPLPEQHKTSFPLRAFISLRSAGDMGYEFRDTLPARAAFYRELGIEAGDVFTISQGHTREVILLQPGDLPDRFAGRTADGWVSAGGRRMIGVTVADCVPILIYDAHGEVFGLVHSGWKGTGILENALCIFTQKLHRKPAGLRVCMGPAVRACCYRVPRERAEEFSRRYGENTVIRRADQYFIDLYRANINICERWGISRIMLMEECTACDTRLGSYRAQGPKDFTRMMVLCGNITAGLQGD
jgi:YfiH family protein